jgi:hypothetical protein
MKDFPSRAAKKNEHSMFSRYNACLRTQGDIISTFSELVTLSLSLIFFFAALTIAQKESHSCPEHGSELSEPNQNNNSKHNKMDSMRMIWMPMSSIA